MKKLVALGFFLAMPVPLEAEVSTRVCLSDGNTAFRPTHPNCPHVLFPDIMVGTKLTIIVSSDTDGYWPCDLAIRGENRNYGVLSARDFNESTGHYDGSIFEAAIGDGGYVYLWHDDLTETDGFSYTGDPGARIGDWFIIDYYATSVGHCDVGLYEWFSIDPTCELSFSHVPTRDFSQDSIVNFVDFSVLASYYQRADCYDPNWCEGADLNSDGSVDPNDLILFCSYWLETTK